MNIGCQKISVIIVNWKSHELLRVCIAALFGDKLSQELVQEIIVIDNSNEDSGFEGYNSTPVSLKVIRNTENIGFARACNQGAKIARSEYLLFLNPDTEATGNVLMEAVQFLETPCNSSYAACGIQLRDVSGKIARSCTKFPSAFSFVLNSVGLQGTALGISDGFHMAKWAHDKDLDVDHIIGAFYLVRTKVFRAVGGFDERFLVYLEDLDLSLRLASAGWRIRYLSTVFALHIGGGASAKALAARLYYSLSSRLRYSRKNHSAPGFICVSLFTLCLEPLVRTLYSCFSGGALSVLEITKSYIWLWADFARTGAGEKAALPR